MNIYQRFLWRILQLMYIYHVSNVNVLATRTQLIVSRKEAEMNRTYTQNVR